MFEDEYRRMNDNLHPDERLIRQTLTAPGRRHQAPRRTPLPAALAVLVCLIALIVTPRVLRRVPATDVTSASVTAPPAASFTPIGHTTTVDGMTLRYLSSYSANGSTYVLLSLQGESVSGNMSLSFALTSEKTGQTFWVGAGQIDHDAARHLSTFMLEFHEEDLEAYTLIELEDGYWRFPSQAWGASDISPLPDHDRLTLTLLAYRHLLCQPLADALPLSDLPTDAATTIRTVDEVLVTPADDPYWQTTTIAAHNALPQDSYPKAWFTGKTVLADGASCLPYADFSVTAAFDGDHLRVQTETSGRAVSSRASITTIGPASTTTFAAWVFLVPGAMPDDPWKTSLVEGVYTPAALYQWSDAENGIQYRDYRFDVSRDTLLSPHGKGWQLYIMGMRTTTLAEMTTRLAFTLGEAGSPGAIAYQPDGQAQ